MPRVNPKPLVIFATEFSLVDSPIIKAFIEKGHTVITPSAALHDQIGDCDVMIGSKCWRIDPRLRLGDDATDEESLERQLEMMIKGVRAIKFPKEKKDDAKETTNS